MNFNVARSPLGVMSEDETYVLKRVNSHDIRSHLGRLNKVPDENSLVELAKVLKEKGIFHKLWVEQPENFPTCLVIKPYPKEEVQMYFKKFKLMK